MALQPFEIVHLGVWGRRPTSSRPAWIIWDTEWTNKQNNINKMSGVGLGLTACKPTTQEAEARGCQVGGQPGLHQKTCQKGKKILWKKSYITSFSSPSMCLCVHVCVRVLLKIYDSHLFLPPKLGFCCVCLFFAGVKCVCLWVFSVCGHMCRYVCAWSYGGSRLISVYLAHENMISQLNPELTDEDTLAGQLALEILVSASWTLKWGI